MSKIQSIFQSSYSTFRKYYHASGEQAKAATAILNCRTSALGGHKYECEDCGHTVIRYNSCRNRHCPLVRGSIKKFG